MCLCSLLALDKFIPHVCFHVSVENEIGMFILQKKVCVGHLSLMACVPVTDMNLRGFSIVQFLWYLNRMLGKIFLFFAWKKSLIFFLLLWAYYLSWISYQ